MSCICGRLCYNSHDPAAYGKIKKKISSGYGLWNSPQERDFLKMRFNKKRKLSAAQTLAFGFALIIVTGALLLMLPISSKDGQPIGFLDALFTATSATCVTGLVVFDTYLQFTLFGQIVILTLIQIGGLGFMTFAILFSMVLRKKIGLRERAFLMEAVSADRLAGVVRLARRVLFGTLLIEGTGALLLSLRFCPMLGLERGVWYGVFHAVSAFCNAGFDLFGYQAPYQSLVGFESDPLVLLTIAGLIVVGGIGFVVWDDVVEHRLNIRRYTLHAKAVLFGTAMLLAGSTVLFYILEADASFAGMTAPQRLLAAFFQAVTPRTAGFNAVDLTQLSEGGALLTMLLMLVGAAPGSTGGGMKLTTVAVLMMAVSAHLRRRNDVDLFSRRIDPETVRKAFCNCTFYLSLMLSVSFVILAVQQEMLMKDVFFECISAIGTVGLSTGITRDLLPLSKALVLLLMYVGRVGSVTVFIAVSRKKTSKLRYPVEHIIIG